MALITRTAKGSRLSTSDMDGNLTYLKSLSTPYTQEFPYMGVKLTNVEIGEATPAIAYLTIGGEVTEPFSALGQPTTVTTTIYQTESPDICEGSTTDVAQLIKSYINNDTEGHGFSATGDATILTVETSNSQYNGVPIVFAGGCTDPAGFASSTTFALAGDVYRCTITVLEVPWNMCGGEFDFRLRATKTVPGVATVNVRVLYQEEYIVLNGGSTVNVSGVTTWAGLFAPINTTINNNTATHGFTSEIVNISPAPPPGNPNIKLLITAPSDMVISEENPATLSATFVSDAEFDFEGDSFSGYAGGNLILTASGLTSIELAYFTQAGTTPALKVMGKDFLYSARGDILNIADSAVTATISESDIIGTGTPVSGDTLIVAYNTLTITHALDTLFTMNLIYIENTYGDGVKQYIQTSGLSTWTVTENSIIINATSMLTSPSLVWKAETSILKME